VKSSGVNHSNTGHLPIERQLEKDPASWQAAKALLKTNPIQAISQLRSLAENGSILSMIDLGRTYAMGIGIDRDDEQAEMWFVRAASSGSVRAHQQLARFYMRIRQYAKAKQALEYAAARQYAPAIHDLGKLYFKGLGVEKNLLSAEVLVQRASRMGSVFATRLLARILMEDHTSRRRRLKGLWLRLRVFWDLVVVLCTEGLDSEKLIR
jgi:TPR repeat protein